MKRIDRSTLDALSAAARAEPRRRKNLNLHDSYDDPCQRLLNALEPGTYIRPHRHWVDAKPECFVGLRGTMALVLFTDDGAIEDVLRFGPAEAAFGADLPAGRWHTVVCLEAGSVFFETKPGPYRPMTDKDMAPWAPAEGSPEVREYLESVLRAVNREG